MYRTDRNVFGTGIVVVTLITGMALFGMGCDGLYGPPPVGPVNDTPTTDNNDTSPTDNDTLPTDDDTLPTDDDTLPTDDDTLPTDDDTLPTDDDTLPTVDDVSAAAVSFSEDLLPLFARRCTVCHVDGGFADLQGIDLRFAEDDTYDQLVDQVSIQRSDLTLVTPGDSAASLLFLKVSSDTPPVGNRMPLGGTLLADDEIAMIRDWIDQGALDN